MTDGELNCVLYSLQHRAAMPCPGLFAPSPYLTSAACAGTVPLQGAGKAVHGGPDHCSAAGKGSTAVRSHGPAQVITICHSVWMPK